MNRLIGWMAAHPVAANLLMMLIIVGGLVSAFGLRQEVFPEINFDAIETRVVYQGASPDEVEASIVQRIEEQIEGVDGVDRVYGIAAEGVGLVRVELQRGVSGSRALEDIKSAVDRITTFPDQIERPVSREIISKQRVMELAIFGPVDDITLRELAYRAKDEIAGLPGISLAEVSKVRDYEISIEVPNAALRAYGLTLSDIAQTVRRSSLDLPGGNIETGAESILLRTMGRNTDRRDFSEIIVVSSRDGASVRLGDIARIRDTLRDDDLIARFDGHPAAFVQVFRVGEEKVLDVVGAVERYIDESFRPNLPPGISVKVWRNDATEFRNRMNLLIKNGLLGLVLVTLALAIFLELRLAFWVSAGMAVAFIGTFAIMALLDLSINMLSLFGFILAIGIVVDDAIVMGENIHAEYERTGDVLGSAVIGAQRISVPVSLAVATTVVAFVPLLFVPGNIGKFLYQIPAIVIIVLVVSVIEALFIMPHHLAYARSGPRGRISALFARMRGAVDRALRRFIDGPLSRALAFATDHYGVVIASAFTVFVLTIGVISAGYVRFSFFPQVEGRYVTASLELAQGTQAEVTLAAAQHLEKAARQAATELDPGGELITSLLLMALWHSRNAPVRARPAHFGLVQGHTGSVVVELMDPELRNRSRARAFEQRWRQPAGALPQARKLTFASNVINLGSPVQIRLAARDDKVLARGVQALEAELSRIAGVYDVRNDREPGKREVQFRLTPYGRSLGLSVDSLSQQVRSAFFGAEAVRVQRGRDEVRVYVRLPENERDALADINQVRIRTATGGFVPVQQVADVRLEYGAPMIVREDGQRVNSVFAEVDAGVVTGQQVNARLTGDFLPRLVQDMPGLNWSMGGEQREQGKALPSLATNFLLSVFGMYALLALAFRSYVQPFIVVAAIPFGLVGATIGHLALDLSFGLTSLFGIVGLSGIIVNGSLVLDRFPSMSSATVAWHRARRSLPRAKSRFRPVLLTAVTTFLGIFPLIIERSIQAQFLIPLAVSIGVGVLLGTVLLMLLTPALVMWQADLARWLRGDRPVSRPSRNT
ncbi:MAG: efflux RND transporter permease subunit [Burkholderiaceae bacterium]